MNISTPESLTKLEKHGRAGLFLTIAALITLITGCYGSFPLTRAVYRGNGNVYSSVEGDRTQRKIAQSAVFWVFLPVYAGAAIGDAAVFNLIEFWTGNRTSLGPSAHTETHNGVEMSMEASPDGQELVLTVSENGAVLGREHFVRVAPDTFTVRDGQGQLVGRVLKTPDGSLRLTDAKGRDLHFISAAEIARLRAGKGS